MTTRRQLLVAGAAALLVAPESAEAKGQDRSLLVAMTQYLELVVYSYELALHGAPLTHSERRTLAALRDRALQEDATIRAALARLGAPPPPRRPAKFEPLPPEVAKQPDRAGYLRYVISGEETALAGWYSAVQKLSDDHVLDGAVAYMASGGRRVVIVRQMAGVPLLPRAFETGGS